MYEKSRCLIHNGEKEWKPDEDWEEEFLAPKEATEFRGIAARSHFLSLDCPDLQFPVKDVSGEMSKPKVGSWKRMKNSKIFVKSGSSCLEVRQDPTDLFHVMGESD